MSDGELILVAAALLAAGIAASLLASRIRLPGLLLFLGVGMAIGSDGMGWIEFGTGSEDYQLERTIGVAALALILFEGGLTAGFEEIRPVLRPSLADREVEIVTWGSSFSALAAGRRWSLRGDAGGVVEVDSTWIHLGPDARPARIGEGFDGYAEAAQGRTTSTKLTLAPPPVDEERRRWPLRLTDVDRMGHVNNAVFLNYLEEARDRLVDSLFGERAWDFVVARVAIDYRSELSQSDREVLVRCRVTGFGTSSVRTAGRVLAADGRMSAEAEST